MRRSMYYEMNWYKQNQSHLPCKVNNEHVWFPFYFLTTWRTPLIELIANLSMQHQISVSMYIYIVKLCVCSIFITFVDNSKAGILFSRISWEVTLAIHSTTWKAECWRWLAGAPWRFLTFFLRPEGVRQLRLCLQLYRTPGYEYRASLWILLWGFSTASMA